MNLKSYKFLTILFFLWVFVPVKGFSDITHVQIIKKDGAKLSGELIAEYEAVWFWERVKGIRYFGVFDTKGASPQIHLISETDISSLSKKVILNKTSLYKKYHLDNSLSLSLSPLRGWSYISTANNGHHLKENMYGNFAWDIEKKHWGSTHFSSGIFNYNYYVWNKFLFAPIGGQVADLKRDEEDNEPDLSFISPLSDKKDGNFILLHLGKNFYFSLLHLKKDSIPKNIKVGSVIKAGDFIGRVGNSGKTYVPHLHMTMYYWSKDLKRMVSVPSFFKKVVVKTRNNIKIYHHFSPLVGQSIKDPR